MSSNHESRDYGFSLFPDAELFCLKSHVIQAIEPTKGNVLEAEMLQRS